MKTQLISAFFGLILSSEGFANGIGVKDEMESYLRQLSSYESFICEATKDDREIGVFPSSRLAYQGHAKFPLLKFNFGPSNSFEYKFYGFENQNIAKRGSPPFVEYSHGIKVWDEMLILRLNQGSSGNRPSIRVTIFNYKTHQKIAIFCQ
jgi:hypothetical protein